ncbi:MAG: ribosome biogenesis GTP-binding protein YihA/YsxC [Deltaproteobacteria bacterium]|nr:ribosome biogenesis GTP-binding protein YihA/YsxC [Deltaproteobacteria bacterium]
MRVLNAEFLRSIVDISQRKFVGVSEVGFIGRSNVGKSSLINCLLTRKVARTSSSPGATKTINLYKIEYEYKGKRRWIILSDFPGFGYTALPKNVYENWERMVDSYISENTFIKRIIWVLDVRRTFDRLDHLTLNWLTLKKIDFSVAVTKVDKVSKSEALMKKDELLTVVGDIPIFLVSAKQGTGRKELLGHIFDSVV